MRAAVNIEGVVALLFLGWMIWRGRKPEARSQKPEEPAHLFYAAGLVAIVIAVFLRSLWFPLVSDDYILVTQAGRLTGSLLTGFARPGGDGSYRPLGYALLVASGVWAHTDAFRWHVISLTVHAANSLLVFFCSRFAFRRSDVAVLAAGVFALHGTRPEAAAWVAGRWDVLAAFFALGGLLAFVHYYENGNRLLGVVSILLAAAGIMCKESAYAFPALALAFAGTKQIHWRRLLVTLIAPAVMLAWRFALFHGPGGYIDPQTGRAQILSIHFVPVVNALFLRLWAVLMFPIDWARPPEFYLIAAIVAMLACLAALSILAHPDRRAALVATGCTMAAALPAIHLLGIGPDLLGSRILYLASVPFAVLVALAIASLERVQLARVLAGCIVLFYASTLAHNLGIWARVSRLADRTCIAAAQKFTGATDATVIGIPVAIDGVNFFANGLAQCVALHSASPPAKWTITHDAKEHPKTSGAVLVWDGR